MTDSNLVRVLQAQCRGAGRADRLPGRRARAPRRSARASAQLRAEGVAHRHRRRDRQRRPAAPRAARCDDMPLVTAGSGVAIGLPRNFGIAPSDAGRRAAAGAAACARSSRAAARRRRKRQVRGLHRLRPRRRSRVDPLRIAAGDDVAAEALALGDAAAARDGPVLVYSTAEPADVRRVQQRLGVAAGGRRWSSSALARDRARAWSSAACASWWSPAARLRAPCVQALGVAQLRIGPQIDPGVPWCHAATRRRRAAPAPGAEVRQLRRRRLLHARPFALLHERVRRRARRSAASARACSSAATCTRTAGNISVRLPTTAS